MVTASSLYRGLTYGESKGILGPAGGIGLHRGFEMIGGTKSDYHKACATSKLCNQTGTA